LRGYLLCFVTVWAGVVAEADADAWLRDALARALEANERWEQLAAEFREENARLRAENERLREENARLRERDGQREAELERVNAELAVLQRLVFGRSSEQVRPAAGEDDGGDTGGDGRGGGKSGRPRGPGARAGRRDYSHRPGSR
jgi:transposase